MRLSFKLALICALAAAAPLVISSIIITRSASTGFREAAVSKLENQSRSAGVMYEKRLLEMRSAIQGLADSMAVNSLVDGSPQAENPANRARLQDLLTHARDELSLDFLIVVDATGKVIARHNDVPSPGETLADVDKDDPIAERVLAAGNRSQVSPAAAGLVEGPDFLSKMWLDKAARVEGTNLNKAVVIEAAAPIFSSGRFSGVLIAGQMLNNYFVARPGASSLQIPLVTEVRDKLLPGADGSGALFALNDSVIASSVVAGLGGQPVLKGAPCRADEVFELIQNGGREYGVAWRPLLVASSAGAVDKVAVGVAVPSGQLFRANTTILNVILAAVLVDLLLAAIAGLIFGRMLSSRLKHLTEAVQRMSVGELSTSITGMDAEAGGAKSGRKTNGSGSNDEIGALAQRLDEMRETFRQAIERQRKR